MVVTRIICIWLYKYHFSFGNISVCNWTKI